jgi:hypothetical protein
MTTFHVFDAALAFVAPTAGRTHVAVTLAPLLVIHRRQVAIAPSLAVAPRHSSPSSCHRAIHCCPSQLRSRSIAISLALFFVKELVRHPLPSCHAVHHRQGDVHCHTLLSIAVNLSIAVKLP